MEPTRHCHDRASLIDVIRLDLLVVEYGNRNLIWLTDHMLTYCILNIPLCIGNQGSQIYMEFEDFDLNAFALKFISKKLKTL